jgi:conjugal transfer pilus assembly protein TraW
MRALFTLMLILSVLSGVSAAENLGTVGATYPIVERDSLEEIEEKAAEVDWNKVLGEDRKEEMVRNFRPKDLKSLTKAEEDRVFSVDMTYTLPFDIPEGKGGILYPRGYSFNPLEYVFSTAVLVFIDGADPEQVEWFRASEYYGDVRVKLLLTGGSYFGLIEELGMPIFYASDVVVSRLRLKAVPSVVMQKGKSMEVREVALEGEKDAS